MDKVRKFFGFLIPTLVIAGIAYFVYYSLVLYKPSDHLACNNSTVAQQTDIAVHVVRQWAGKEGQQYQGCQESGR